MWPLKTALKLVVVVSFNLFIYSFKKYLLSAFCEANAVNKIETELAFMAFIPSLSPLTLVLCCWPTTKF